jgi:serine/threonine protein kinase
MSPGTWNKLGKYEVGALVGQGGMGQVFEGRHPALDRKVAIKVIHPYLAMQPRFVERFQQEAQSVAALRHPNVVQVFDFDVDGGVYFMVMEFIDGMNLAACLEYLRSDMRLLQLRHSIDLLITLCHAVEYAHQQDMIHRDLKPENVMFTKRGQPIVTDFGIAKIVGSIGKASLQSLGTPLYISPEQALGRRVDRRSDVYSLAIMLYEMVTGAPPFHGDTPLEIAMKHVQQSLPSARKVNPRVSDSIELVLNRALAKTPDRRYQSCAEFASALEVTRAAGEQILAEPADSPQAEAVRNDLALDYVTEALVHYLGPFGGMIDLGRIASSHGGSAAAIASSQLDDVLTQIASENEITDRSKMAAIREMVITNFEEDAKASARRNRKLRKKHKRTRVNDGSVTAEFFVMLERELLAVLGPEAVRILDFDRRVSELGFSRESFPRERLGDLIEQISSSIRDENTRKLFNSKAVAVVEAV